MARIRTVKLDTLPSIQEMTRFQCCLYVIREAGTFYFKIGIATHPMRRICALQGGNPRRLEFFAIYEGTRPACAEIEKLCLKFLGVKPGSEWSAQEDPSRIINFLSAFAEEDK